MLCSNCGKDIPFTGNVCPYCHADKERDKMVHAIAMATAFGVLLLGMAISAIKDNFCVGLCISFPVALVAGGIAFVIATATVPKK